MEITIQEIIELLKNKQYKQLRATLENMYPYEISELFNAVLSFLFLINCFMHSLFLQM